MKNTIKNVIDEIRNRIDDVEVEARDVIKNNGVKLTGIAITDGMHTTNISPVYYINDMAEAGYSDLEIADYIIKEYLENSAHDFNYISNNLYSYDNVKDSLTFQLVNEKLNRDWLANYIFFDYLDLALVPIIKVEDTRLKDGYDAFIRVTKELADIWGVSDKTIYKDAESGIKSEWTITRDLNSIIADTGLAFTELPMSNMTILTNKTGTYGAAHILDLDAIRCVANEQESDLIIIPSSVHELILIPFFEFDQEDLEDIIGDVNSTHLKKTDILSDHAYLYMFHKNKVISF